MSSSAAMAATNSVINSLSGALAKTRLQLAESERRCTAAEADAACVPELREAITHLSSMTRTLLQRASRQADEISRLRAEKRQRLPTTSSPSSPVSSPRGAGKEVEVHIARMETVCEKLLMAGQPEKETVRKQTERTARANTMEKSARNVNREKEDELTRKCQKLAHNLEIKTQACSVLVEEVQQQLELIESQRTSIQEQGDMAASALRQLVQCRQQMQQLREGNDSATMHTTALRETAKALRVRHSESMAHLAQLRTNTLPLMFYAEKEHLRETKEYLRESLNAFAILLQWGLEKVKTMDPVFVEKPNMRPLLKKHQQQKQKQKQQRQQQRQQQPLRPFDRFKMTLSQACATNLRTGVDLRKCLRVRAMNRGDGISLHSLRGALRRDLVIPTSSLSDVDIRSIFQMFSFVDCDREYASIEDLSSWVEK
jgi:hypothetical protein